VTIIIKHTRKGDNHDQDGESDDGDQEHKKKNDDDQHVNLYMSTRKGKNNDQQ